MKTLSRIWIVVKTVMAVLTVLTIILLFLSSLPSIMEGQIVQDYPYLPHIFLVVIFFWCVYLVKWIRIG